MERIETLCWTCTAPGTGRCGWDRKKPKPVEGWYAIPHVMIMSGKAEMSYLVLACPLYEQCATAKNIRRREKTK